ncbi:hypothetical protein PTD2_00756 [Pseudoalteromonas tunicata D2]|uniref:Uncharacterized protein n=1 Tax=Pseudoalteromonas tunicata D2 TaxID=87626 RepID=A4C3C2_9GAMM|nr:hypothetical protein PTD2_00756 [Pseudoalteromonas tunicata D2]
MKQAQFKTTKAEKKAPCDHEAECLKT